MIEKDTARQTGTPMRHSRRDTGLIIVLLLLILALAAGLRFYNLGSQSLWSDEGNSAALATRSLAQIAQAAAHDIHPPLYYWLLRLWTTVFGLSELALRSLSAVLGTLLVLVIYGLGTRLFNRTTGLAAAFIAAIAPFQVYYSQEARMYILVALEAALAALLFWWFVAQEDARLPVDGSPPPTPHAGLRLLPFSGLLLTLVWVAGIYTHYAFPLMIGLLSLLYLAWLIVSRRRGLMGWRALRWGLLLILTLVLYTPWLTTAIQQLLTWPRVVVQDNLGTQLRTLLATLTLGPVAEVAAGNWWAWLLPTLALLGALPWPLTNRHGTGGSVRLDWLRFTTPVAWVVAPVAMIVAFGLFREAYLKFLLIASPALSLLLARAVLGPTEWLLRTPPAVVPESTEATTKPSRAWWRGTAGVAWTISTLAVIGALSGAALARYYTDPTLARDDYRSIAQFVVATAHPNDAIVLIAPGQAEVFNYYYNGDLPVYALPQQRPLDLEATLAELEKLMQHDKIYVVNWAAEEADPLGVVPSWMDTRGYKTLDQWYGNVRLAVYVMPEHSPPEEIVDDLKLRFGEDIELLGYRGWKLAPTAGEVTQLQLQWRADQKPDRRYKVFLQLLDPRDQVIAQRDAEPAGEGRPTDGWQPGEVVLDNHGLLIPPGTPPGTYRRIIGLYDADTMERLKLPDGTDFVSLPPVTVARAKTPPPLAALDMMNRQRFDFGGVSLLGHDHYKRGFRHAPETQLRPGDLLHLTFYWQANVTSRADWWFDLSLSDSGGNTVASMQAPLVSESYGTTLWQEGEVVRGEHDMQIPADLPPGQYRLSLIMTPDDKTPVGTAYLGTVKVAEK
jgi:4-amino-4-deoxy-L-arabinose transferase-like glycosyltransferase